MRDSSKRVRRAVVAIVAGIAIALTGVGVGTASGANHQPAGQGDWPFKRAL